MNKSHTIIISIFVIVLVVLSFSLWGEDSSQVIKEDSTSNTLSNEDNSAQIVTEEDPVIEVEIKEEGDSKKQAINEFSWQNTELKDLRTGESYKISQFEKPVILETFAVWCPKCKSQQEKIKSLIASGDDSIHISIDIDPNEDESQVLSHLQKNSFDWYFSIFPADATTSLIKEFGNKVISAPSTPVILICPGEEGRLLRSGIKSSIELANEIASCN